MCLAIVKLPDASVPEDNLKRGWIANPDGAGFAYVKDGKVVIEKRFMSYKAFREEYLRLSSLNSKSKFLIHFRIGTSGAKDASNTHPFAIDGGALIHNGCLTGTEAVWGTGASDTNMFANMFRSALSYDSVNNNMDKLNDALIGSKICLLYDDGRHLIINEKSGYWEKGVWYSNRSFLNTKIKEQESDDAMLGYVGVD